ncbi:MAG: PRC-barrel domain-containing protein [Lachnotalea sp.]
MLNKAKVLKNYKLNSLDGEIGKVKGFYFEDQSWFLKYLIVNTGNWLINRQVLILPSSIISINKEEEYITTNLTKDQIENSPSLDSDKPVSLQFQEKFYGYYGLPIFAMGIGNGGGYRFGYGGGGRVVPCEALPSNEDNIIQHNIEENNWDPHLRSTQTVSGYTIDAIDDKIGHVDDFIIDDENWKIQYIEIDTKNWIPGKKILISPNWIENVNWGDSKVSVNLYCEEIRQSPEYTNEAIIDRDYEIRLHQHYKRKAYWTDLLEAQDSSVK